MNTPICFTHEGKGALIAAAIHDGHHVRPEVWEKFSLNESERLREEDPFTRLWTSVAPTQVIGLRSRFEVDLNRPREKAVYQKPEDAWGLNVWTEDLSEQIVGGSLALYDDFYSQMASLLKRVEDQYGRFVVFDIHTYNHRRAGPAGPEADPKENPEVNIGTGTLERERWAPILDGFIEDLSSFDFLGRRLDVGENVKFKGGQFSRWIHTTFPETGCSIAVEFKKFFMDEWTGEPDRDQVVAITRALESTVPGVLKNLALMG